MTRVCTISVVVSTKNRLSSLKKCILSLLKQSYVPKEIIIVDDCSDVHLDLQELLTDNILKIRINKKPFRTKILFLRNKSHAGVVASRNAGIFNASGDIVAFLDDDGYAHRDWIKKLVKHYKNTKIGGEGGPVLEKGRKMMPVIKPVKRLAFIKNGRIKSHYRITDARQKIYLPQSFVPILPRGNMSFRRSTLLKIQGGDIAYNGNYYREETDLGLKASKIGKLYFDPEALTYHKTAKSGGCRDIICDDINKFFYFMFKNTIYLFFKHFNIKKAAQFTVQAIRTQIKLILKHETGLTRSFSVSSRHESISAVLRGSFRGLYDGILLHKRMIFGKNNDKMVYSQPSSLSCFEIVIIGSSIKIIELESKTHIISKILGI